ncbi:MAG TPA: nucleoside recognition protein, partial [Clostridiales bacterium]|nr:nucleoside recognition protein [Clostridiales bacterium]
ATSIQLIPATVMSLLASNGATNPSSIILPTLISTAVSTVAGIILVKVLYKK